MEGLGFLDALNSAPIPGIKIKKKKKVLSPTAAKVRRWLPASPSLATRVPFLPRDPAQTPLSPRAPSPVPSRGNQLLKPVRSNRPPRSPAPPPNRWSRIVQERRYRLWKCQNQWKHVSWGAGEGKNYGGGVQMCAEPLTVPPAGSAEVSGDAKSGENATEGGQLTKKGRKKKTVSWPEENKLREYFYFELDETERGESCPFPMFVPLLWVSPGFLGVTLVFPSLQLTSTRSRILRKRPSGRC